MNSVVVKKFAQMVIVLFLVTFLVAVLLKRLPGDPCIANLGGAASPEKLAECQERVGTHDNAFVFYGKWINNTVHGDFGALAGNDQPVTTALKQKWVVTVSLILYSIIFSSLLAVPIAVYAAYRANGRFDRAVSTASYGLLAIPNFVMAVLLWYFLAINLTHLLPATEWVPLTADPIEHLKHAILPVLVLAAGQIPVYVRLLRTDMAATLSEDFITMAKSKGISDRRILWRHALRPSSFTLVTILGIQIGQLVGGALIVEQFFHLNGFGSFIVQAVFSRDYAVVQTLTALVAVVVVVMNFLVDMIYVVLDPRIRRARALA
jgi:peptide/nickel transport system permease protein